MICIYCLLDKDQSEFSHKEHVIPQAFGHFQNNLTLNCVCNTCNQFFGDNLELKYNRDSWDALNRYKYGIKTLDKLNDLLYKNLSIKCSESGNWLGAKYIFYNENNQIQLDLPPQIGIKEKSGDFIYFTLNELKKLTKDFFDNFEKKGRINVISKNDIEYEEIFSELDRIGIKYSKVEEVDNLQLNEEFKGEAEIQYSITSIIIRTISKICFNYLAYCLGPEFALKKDFNSIRKYILLGSEENRPEFTANYNPILYNEPEQGKRILGHIIVLEWGRGFFDVNVKVSLFNDITYNVTLSKNYSSIYFDLRHGHVFNLNTMEIESLSHTKSILLP